MDERLVTKVRVLITSCDGEVLEDFFVYGLKKVHPDKPILAQRTRAIIEDLLDTEDA